MDPVLADGYLHWLRALVNLADRAMADEDVPADVRDRVVARLYGSGPDDLARQHNDPQPHDLAVLQALADVGPDVRVRRTWDGPAVNNGTT